MAYRFRIYYRIRDVETIRKIKDKFKTTVSVNYESDIVTDEYGKWLIEETERRGFIMIREIRKVWKE